MFLRLRWGNHTAIRPALWSLALLCTAPPAEYLGSQRRGNGNFDVTSRNTEVLSLAVSTPIYEVVLDLSVHQNHLGDMFKREIPMLPPIRHFDSASLG